MKILFILDIISATCQQGICLETSSVERDPVYVCVCVYIYLFVTPFHDLINLMSV